MFYNALKKYGWDNFDHEILVEARLEELDDLERFYIQKFNSNNKEFGYNLESGGNKNKTFAESTLKKLSKSKIGHCVDEHTRNKIREKQKGQHHSIDTEFKKGHTNKGWKWKETSRKKLSNSRKGIKFSEEHINKLKICHCKPVIQYDLNMNFICEYTSAREASRKTNTHATSIGCCCNGKLKTSNNSIWRWKT